MSEADTESTPLDFPCPLCGVRHAAVMMCSPCWLRTDGGHGMTEEERVKVALFERCAPMTKGHRQIFTELQARLRRGQRR